MRRALLIVLLFALGCTEAEELPVGSDASLAKADSGPSTDGPADASITSDSDPASSADQGTAPEDTGPAEDTTVPPEPFTFELGEGEPFVAWQNGGELPVVAGIQGGFHTEHVVRVAELTFEELGEATITASILDGETELTTGAWIYDRSLWTQTDDGFTTELPPLVFYDEPTYDTEVELIGSIELTSDARTEEFRVNVVLVPL